MARSRGSVRPTRSAPSRSSHTAAAAPSAYHAPPPAPAAHAPMAAAPQQPGMFAQMATTAAGVAVGSAVGHTLGHAVTGMFGGSSSNEASAPQQQQQAVASYSQPAAGSCDIAAKDFTRCLESTGNDMSACDYYLGMLKACQSSLGSTSGATGF
ncbi:hypothetical protein H4R19_001218 [Coemansia spiralis]|nr:hypothetical protein H4R19_001218 [Coemansia spiralis]